MHSRNQRDRLLDAIMRRAATDFEFRRCLLTDPRSAIYDNFGVRVPDGYSVKFVEREPGVDALVVLPDSVNESEGEADSDELSDADLEAISGGISPHYMWALDFSPGGAGGHADTKPSRRNRRDTA